MNVWCPKWRRQLSIRTPEHWRRATIPNCLDDLSNISENSTKWLPYSDRKENIVWNRFEILEFFNSLLERNVIAAVYRHRTRFVNSTTFFYSVFTRVSILPYSECFPSVGVSLLVKSRHGKSGTLSLVRLARTPFVIHFIRILRWHNNNHVKKLNKSKQCKE